MSRRSLLQLVAGLALALVLAVGWTSPGQAHGGHDAAASQAHAEPARSAEVAAAGAGGHADRSASASEPDCAGRGSSSESTGTACCGDACHAVMSTELGFPIDLSIARTASPHAAGPPALQGPTIHIKRPPRRLAASVF